MNNLLKYTLLGGIFLIPFIPFIVADGMFFPFITGKGFLFRILIEVLLGAWIILAYRVPSYRLRWSWLLGAFVAFVGVIALADFFGENPFKSFWSNYERMEGLITLIHLFAYFLVAAAVLNTEKLWERFFNTFLGASVIMGVYGLLQIAGVLQIHQGSTRVDGTLGNAAYLGIYALFNVFLAAFLLLKRKRRLEAGLLYGSVIALNVTMLYFTATRGAILGFLGGVLLTTVLVALFERERPMLRKGAIAALAGIILLVGGFFVAKDTAFVRGSEVLSRMASISLEGGSVRFMVWNMAYQGFKERPVLGWGQENFNFVFNKYYDPGMYSQEQWFDRAHNVFFDWLIAGGILGLLAYLSLFAAALFLLWFRLEEMSVVSKSILTGLFAGYFFHNIFVFDNLISYLLFFSVLAYIHAVYVRGRKSKSAAPEPKKARERRAMDALVAPLVIVAVVFSLYFFNYKGMAANYALIDALRPQEKGVLVNLENFERSLAYDSFGAQEAREQLSQISLRVAGLQNVDAETKQKFLSFAEREMLRQIEHVPGDARHEFFIGTFLNRLGRQDEAIAHLQKALELSPRKQSIQFELGAAYLNKKQYAEALEIMRAAYESEPNYAEARDLYALAALYTGDIALAEELLLPAYGTIAVPEDRFINAFLELEKYGKIVEIWETRVADSPDNPQFHLSLAAAYLGNGERLKAIVEIEMLIELNPDFKDQGEYYISEIKAGRNP